MKPKCKLTGVNGNAFNIIAIVCDTLRKAGQKEKIKEYQDKAMSGDYDNLLCVSAEYVILS